MKKTCLSLITVCAVLTGCSKNPVTGKNEITFIPRSAEIAVGKENYFKMQQAQGGAYVDDEVQEYVSRVGLTLARLSDRPDLPYEFVVINDSTPNAWALPGGKIAIHRGLLTELKSEAELAAVLSHEIVHSAARHGAKGMERNILMQTGLIGIQQLLSNYKYQELALGSAAITAGLVTLKYSRTAELEADHYGIKYMVAAGYDPQAAVELQETFLRLAEDKNPSWIEGLFASHPPSKERIKENIKTSSLYPEGGSLGEKEYQPILAKLKAKEPSYKKLEEGYAALREGKYEKALALANDAIKINSKEAHLFNLKGKAERKLKLLDDAEVSFSKAIHLNPDFFEFHLQRGLTSFALGNQKMAKSDLEKSLSLFPTSPAHYALGEIQFKQGKMHSAREHFRLAHSGK